MIKPNAITKNVSPIRLRRIADSADFIAVIRIDQNEISKYDITPTNSQPMKSIRKLSATTRIVMKSAKILRMM